MNVTEARHALWEADRARSAGRIGRLLQQPSKLLRGRFLRATGRLEEITVPTFWGGEFAGVLPEHVSTMIWRFGFTDRTVCLSMLERLPEGGTFVDIGAHFGFFTLLGSALAGPEGRVVSIEAMPATRERLMANVAERAAHPNVTVIPYAASDTEATLTFRDFGTVDSSLNSAHTPRGDVAAGRPVEVRALPMDTILAGQGIDRADLVKIDAESSELEVLKGMESLIGRDPPPIIVEMASMTPEQTAHAEAIHAWLADRGYAA